MEVAMLLMAYLGKNADDDLSTKKCVSSKTKGVTVIKRINEIKTSVKQANLAGGPTTLEQKRSFRPRFGPSYRDIVPSNHLIKFKLKNQT